MLTDAGLVLPNLTQLRIYPSFTEIRQEYNAPKNFRIYFSRNVFSNIVRSSLSIEGIPIESKQITSKSNNLDNQTVFVRRNSKDEPQQCLVIQSDDLILQDIKTKRYFHTQRSDLEYISIPEQEGTEISYVIKQPGKATLSYQIRGISWSSQYDLNILSDDCKHTFQAFAEIINETKQEYRIDRTELFSGNVRLQNENKAKRFRDRDRSRSRSRSRSSSENSDNEAFENYDIGELKPTIDVLGQIAGLYLYSIDQPFVLLPKSTLTLPFINATIQISKYFGLTLPFTSHTQIQKLQRKYRIESMDKYLPGGSLTIREQDRLIGVTNLPDMAIGDKHTFNAGQDPDISLNRQIQLISKERHSAIYAVHLTFKNMKSTPVKFEYKEIMNCDNVQFKIVLKGSNEQKIQIQITSNGIQIGTNNVNDPYITLPGNGGEQIYEYEIHRNYAKRNDSYRKRRRDDPFNS